MSDSTSSLVPPASWLELPDIRKRDPAKSVWIVLKQGEDLVKSPTKGAGAAGEYSGIDTVAVPLAQREEAAQLDWGDLGGHSTEPHAFDDGRYATAEQFLGRQEQALGVSLVLTQRLNAAHTTQWLLNQDLVLALRLLREEDVWVAIDEGYVDVARLFRDDEGKPVRLSIRAEFLRDYLAARGMTLRGTQYHQRWAVVDDASSFPWAKDGHEESADGLRFELRSMPVDNDGNTTGGSRRFARMWTRATRFPISVQSPMTTRPPKALTSMGRRLSTRASRASCGATTGWNPRRAASA